ncbi:hypothetical protein [Absidia glauca]|uniref:Galactose oxidase n=1 Tax=Absidia glauca TaxID=4829 RepID=A0A163JGV9_ABSGL|nr:hypothetical protein [Absidia glauca]
MNTLSLLLLALLAFASTITTVHGYFYVPNFMATLPFGGGMATAQRNNSMILFGGETDSTAYANTLYQLTQNDTGYTWKSLPQNNAAQGVVYAQAIVSQDQSSLMVIGGQGNFSAATQQVAAPAGNSTSNSTAPASNTTSLPLQLQLYSFASGNWSTYSPPANTAMPPNRKLFSATYGAAANKIYIYGGASSESQVFSDLWVMDAAHATFTQLTPYYQRYGHSGSMTSDGKLVIIGGSIVSGNQDSLASMSQLTVYDTNANKWSIVKTTGTIPSPRSDHSAVITSDDKIIILGGDSNSAPRYKQFTRSVAILDTKTWTWSIPNVQGIPPSSRAYASAAILDGKHVTFAFGSALNVQYNDINVMDVSGTSWLQSFSGETPSSSSGLSTGVIVGVTIACVVLLVIILFVLWKFQAYIRFLASRIHSDIWKPRSGEPVWAETCRIVFQIFFIFIFTMFLVFVIKQAIDSPNVIQRIETASAEVEAPDVRFCFDGYNVNTANPNDPKNPGVSCQTNVGYSCNQFVQTLDMSVFQPVFTDHLGHVQCYLFRAPNTFKLTSTSGSNNGSRLQFTMFGDQSITAGRVHVSVYPKAMDPNAYIYGINDDTPVLLGQDKVLSWQNDERNDVSATNIFSLEPFTYSALSYEIADHRYLQDVGWNYVGFLPIANNTPEITSNFRQEAPNPQYTLNHADLGVLAIQPNAFVNIVDREVKMYTLLNALGFVGGIFGLLIAVQAWLFGFRPRSPWGVVHRWSMGDMKRSLLRGLQNKFKTTDAAGIPLVHPVHKRFSVNDFNNLGYESETQRISRVEERMQVMELLFKAYYVDDEVFRSLDNANKNAPPGYDQSRAGPLFPTSEKVDLAATTGAQRNFQQPSQQSGGRFSHMFNHRNSVNSDSTSNHHLTDPNETHHPL